ncbi:MAG: glutaredoxin family protein [Deltaproteobacteria bacterium]|nr:glutaredoxin family protein [Deltaproteobacteria bacterium]
MTVRLTLYTRRDCCLCDEMKAAIRDAAAHCDFSLDEIDVDGSDDLRERYGDQVPVLLIDGYKAFKYRVTSKALTRRLQKRPSLLNRFLR